MKFKPFVFVSIFFIALAFFTGQVVLAEQDGQKSPEQIQKEMQECMALNQPGAGHRRLDATIGEWDTVQTMWIQGPDADPVVCKGTCSAKWVLNGRYVEETYRTTFTMPDPTDPTKLISMPYEGRGMNGYDNWRNLYTCTWFDSMGTQMFMSKGAWHPKEKKFTFYGEMDEPSLKVTGRMAKCVVTLQSKDKHTFVMYDLHAGENYKVMQIEYTRKK